MHLSNADGITSSSSLEQICNTHEYQAKSAIESATCIYPVQMVSQAVPEQLGIYLASD